MKEKETSNLEGLEKLSNKKRLPIKIAAIIAIVLVATVSVNFTASSVQAKEIEELLTLGEKYLTELEYEQAIVAYQDILKIDPKNVEAYKGIVETYINMGEIEKANEYTQKLYELMKEEEENEKNSKSQGVLNEVENIGKELKENLGEYVRQKANVILNKVLEKTGASEILKGNVEYLGETVKEVSAENLVLIYEQLLQKYITLGEQENDNTYYEKAIEIFEKIKENDGDTYFTYNEVVILFQRLGNFEQAEEWFKDMLSKYPANYMTYIRGAYLEIEKQKTKASEERDYTEFLNYYNKAKQFFEEQVQENTVNDELQLLDNVYQQLVSDGWIK